MSLFADLEEEEFQLSGSGSSGLSFSLFNNKAPASPAATSSPAPSKPEPQLAAQPAKPAEAPSLLHAVAGIPCFRYNQEKKVQEPVGKVGIAILGALSTNVFQLLLYRSNTDHLCNIPIVPQFPITVQKETHISFTDLNRTYWSVSFSSLEDTTNFIRFISLAKLLASKSANLITQDVLPGTGNAIGNGDSVMIKYTAYKTNQGKVGEVLSTNLNDSKPLRFQLGSGQVPPSVETGVVGMKKASRRIIAIPQNQTIGFQPAPDGPIIYQVDIIKVKYQNSSRDSSKSVDAPPSPISSDDTSESASREDLINRTKRLGKSIAPDMNDLRNRLGKPIEESELQSGSDIQSGSSSGISSPQLSQPAGISSPQFSQPPASVATPPSQWDPSLQANQYGSGSAGAVPQPPQGYPSDQNQQQQQQQQQQLLQQQQLSYYQPQLASVPQQTVLSQPPSAYLSPAGYPSAQNSGSVPSTAYGSSTSSETDLAPERLLSKAENTKFLHDAKMIQEEIKLTVVNAAGKIETMHREIKNSIFGRDEEVSKEKISGVVLIQTIQKFVDDNENLQRDVAQKSERIDELREKINAILEKNKALIESHSATMEERNLSLTESSELVRKQLTSLADDKLHAEEELQSVTEQLSNTRRNLSRVTSKNEELSSRFDELSTQIQAQRAQVNLLKSDKISGGTVMNESRMTLQEEIAATKRVEAQFQQLKDELDSAKETLAKFKAAMETQRKKWIQMKAQLDKDHEDERFAAIQKMKSQLLKVKKEKDDAVAEAQNIERETEARWAENIAKIKVQFRERVDDLKHDAQEDKLREISLAVDTLKREGESLLAEAKKDIQEVYKNSFVEAREELIGATSTGQIQQVQKKISGAQDQAKEFMGTVIKSIMSNVYQSLRAEIHPQETRSGAEVLSLLVGAIKTSTFDAIQTVDYHFSQPDPFASLRVPASSKVVESDQADDHDEDEDDDYIPPEDEDEDEGDDGADEELHEDEDEDEEQQLVDEQEEEEEEQLDEVKSVGGDDDEIQDEDQEEVAHSDHEENFLEADDDDLDHISPSSDSHKREIDEFNELLGDGSDENLDVDDADIDLDDQPESEPESESPLDDHKEDEPEEEFVDPLQEDSSSSPVDPLQQEDEQVVDDEDVDQDVDVDDDVKEDADEVDPLQDIEDEDNQVDEEPQPEDDLDLELDEQEENLEESATENPLSETKSIPAPSAKPTTNIDDLFAVKSASVSLDDVFGDTPAASKPSAPVSVEKPKVNVDDIFGSSAPKTPQAKPISPLGGDIFGEENPSSRSTTPSKPISTPSTSSADFDDIFGEGLSSSLKSTPKTGADIFGGKPKSDDIFGGGKSKSDDIFGGKSKSDDIFDSPSSSTKTVADPLSARSSTTKADLDDFFNF